MYLTCYIRLVFGKDHFSAESRPLRWRWTTHFNREDLHGVIITTHLPHWDAERWLTDWTNERTAEQGRGNTKQLAAKYNGDKSRIISEKQRESVRRGSPLNAKTAHTRHGECFRPFLTFVPLAFVFFMLLRTHFSRVRPQPCDIDINRRWRARTRALTARVFNENTVLRCVYR